MNSLPGHDFQCIQYVIPLLLPGSGHAFVVPTVMDTISVHKTKG